MKKTLAILTIAAALAACNNGSEKTAETAIDTVKTESPLMDAVNTADSVGKAMEAGKDSTVKIMEKTKEEVKH